MLFIINFISTSSTQGVTYCYSSCFFAGKNVRLADLLRKVKTSEWYLLGLELIDDETKMNIIKAKHRDDVDGALQDTFSLWIKKCENPTWQMVISVLHKVEENHLAASLEKEYCT